MKLSRRAPIKSLTASLALAFAPGCLSAAVILDNTLNFSEPVDIGQGARLTTNQWIAICFSTGTQGLQLGTVSIPFRMTFDGTGTRQVTVNLYTSTNFEPSGTSVGSASRSIDLVNSFAYQSFDLSGMSLAANSRYALVFQSDETNQFPYLFWCSITNKYGADSVTVGSEISGLQVGYSANGGGNWSGSGNIDGIQLTATPVPEPSSTVLGALALIPLLVVRRRRA